MTYSVKQLADLAGVSARTLHFYDEIGLLKPAATGRNRYRKYDEAAVFRLQQILFYRELDFPLAEIRLILDQPGFDPAEALHSHRKGLLQRAAKLEQLIHTIDKTILHLKGKSAMADEEVFAGFDEETQKRYEEEAAHLWGDHLVKESSHRWKGYSKVKQANILAEAGEIYRGLAGLQKRDPADAEVQQLIARWHNKLRNYYEPNRQIMRGLAQAYCEHPGFRATFHKISPESGFPEFLRKAIEHYCSGMPAEA
jgi:DNA-binding transcriptional MerR regulator